MRKGIEPYLNPSPLSNFITRSMFCSHFSFPDTRARSPLRYRDSYDTVDLRLDLVPMYVPESLSKHAS